MTRILIPRAFYRNLRVVIPNLDVVVYVDVHHALSCIFFSSKACDLVWVPHAAFARTAQLASRGGYICCGRLHNEHVKRCCKAQVVNAEGELLACNDDVTGAIQLDILEPPHL